MEQRPSKCETADRMARECIAVRVRLINRVITALYDEALRPFGLRISQANILVGHRPSGREPARRGLSDSADREVHPQPGRGTHEAKWLAGVGSADRGPEPDDPAHAPGEETPRQDPAIVGEGPGRGEALDRRGRRGGPPADGLTARIRKAGYLSDLLSTCGRNDLRILLYIQRNFLRF